MWVQDLIAPSFPCREVLTKLTLAFRFDASQNQASIPFQRQLTVSNVSYVTHVALRDGRSQRIPDYMRQGIGS